MPYVNRSLQQLDGFNKGMKEQVDEIAGWKKQATLFTGLKANHNSNASDYTGQYSNELYGKIEITTIGSTSKLKVKFLSHTDLEATLSPCDNEEWLLEYSNIEYGVFKTKFKLQNNKVMSVDIKMNDFVESDAYTFTKVP